MSTIKLRGKINFPANVTATGGIGVSKTSGIWTIEPTWTDLELVTTLDTPEDKQLWVLDPISLEYSRLSVDALIDALPPGPTGATGATGATSGILQAYSSTTTDSDPGAGTFRFNNATPASATAAYLDNIDAGGATVSTIFDLWDDSGSVVKGVVRFQKSDDPTAWAQFQVTGSVVDGTGYRKITLANGSGSGAFSAADVFSVSFTRSGDAGTNGAVAISGTPTVNQFANWTDATTIKGTSITGLVKGNGASAPSAAVAGTDYLAPAAIGVTVQAYDAQLSSLVRQTSQSAAYSTVLTDGGKHIYHPAADNNPRTLTIDSGGVAYPVGTVIGFVNEINTLTIAITTHTMTLQGSGATGSRSLAANGVAFALKVDGTKWIIFGTGLT